MTNSKVAPMPIWILFAVPTAAFAALACLIAFGRNPIVAQVAGIAGLSSVGASFIVVPAAIYTLVVNRGLRTTPQFIGTAFCSLPILGMLASFRFGGI